MRAILIRTDESMEEIEIHTYKDYYKHIGADLFDIVRVDWSGEVISIFLDDEGLLKKNLGRDVEGYPNPLFGNLVITGGADSEGETLPLPDSITLFNIDEYINKISYMTDGGYHE